MKKITDVAIIGAGPVGLTLALQLSRAGVRTLVIEQRSVASLGNHPQAHVINARSMEIFRALGLDLSATLRGMVPPVNTWRKFIYCTHVDPRIHTTLATATHVPKEGFGGSWEREVSPEGVAHLSSAKLIPALLHRLQTLHSSTAEVLDGYAIHSLDQHLPLPPSPSLSSSSSSSHPITIMCNSVNGGPPLEVSCSFAVGCDGASSHTRTLAHLDRVYGSRKLERFINVHIRSRAIGQAARAKPAMLYFVYNPVGVACWVAHDLEAGEFVVQIPFFPPYQTVDNDFTPVKVKEFLQRSAGMEGVDMEIVSIKAWSMGATAAAAYNKGRVFLAGDAAHQCPPTGGFGLNTGVGDASNLWWKLALAVHAERLAQRPTTANDITNNALDTTINNNSSNRSSGNNSTGRTHLSALTGEGEGAGGGGGGGGDGNSVLQRLYHTLINPLTPIPFHTLPLIIEDNAVDPSVGSSSNSSSSSSSSSGSRRGGSREKKMGGKAAEEGGGVGVVGLLQSYGDERLPVARSNNRLSVQNYEKVLEVGQCFGLYRRLGEQMMEAVEYLPRPLATKKAKLALIRSALWGSYAQLAILSSGSALSKSIISNVKSLLSGNRDLKLVFPHYDLGYTYTGNLTEETAAPSVPTPDQIDYPFRYRPSTYPGSRFPHSWLEIGDKRLSTLDVISAHIDPPPSSSSSSPSSLSPSSSSSSPSSSSPSSQSSSSPSSSPSLSAGIPSMLRFTLFCGPNFPWATIAQLKDYADLLRIVVVHGVPSPPPPPSPSPQATESPASLSSLSSSSQSPSLPSSPSSPSFPPSSPSSPSSPPISLPASTFLPGSAIVIHAKLSDPSSYHPFTFVHNEGCVVCRPDQHVAFRMSLGVEDAFRSPTEEPRPNPTNDDVGTTTEPTVKTKPSQDSTFALKTDGGVEVKFDGILSKLEALRKASRSSNGKAQEKEQGMEDVVNRIKVAMLQALALGETKPMSVEQLLLQEKYTQLADMSVRVPIPVANDIGDD